MRSRLLKPIGPTEATVTATALDCGSYLRERSMPMHVPIGQTACRHAKYYIA